MTKAEIIDQIIEKKRELKSDAEKKYSQVKKSRDAKFLEIIEKYFGGEFTIEDAYISQKGSGSYEIMRPKPDSDYDRGLIDLRLSDNWKTGEYENLTTSVYSTSDNSDWELERLITVGEVAKVVLDFQDDIIAEFNKVRDDFKKKYENAYTKVSEIERDITSLINEKNQTYLDIAERKLESNEGLVFDKRKKGSIDIRWDWTIRGITNIKILSKTASGKSADIEISTYNETPRKFEKVRMHNVDTILWQYRDYVLTAAE